VVPRDEEGLRSLLGEAHRRYTRHINFREGWRGHLWQERFHSFVMDEQYLLSTVRYVERNPVTARLCREAVDWPWSSARAHIAGKDDGLVSVKPMLELIDDWAAYLSKESASGEVVEHIKQHLRTGRPLGDPQFVTELESLTGRVLAPRRPGRKPGASSG
jgi:putative transposase